MRHIVLYDRWTMANEVQLKHGSGERKVRAEGWFHCWRQEADEEGSGPVAVVEMDDGHVETWPADLVGFDRVERGTTNIVALQDQRDKLQSKVNVLCGQLFEARKALEIIAAVEGEALRDPAKIAADALAELFGKGGGGCAR